MPTEFSIADIDLAGSTLYAVVLRDSATLETVPMIESEAGTFVGSVTDAVPSGPVSVVAYRQLGASPDPSSDWEVGARSFVHYAGGIRCPEAIVVAANADPALSAILTGGVWLDQADDSALAHEAYAEVRMIPPGELREPLLSKGRSADIVTTSWGVAIYATDPYDAERARDAWYDRFVPTGETPEIEDGAGLSWWCGRGTRRQDDDQIDSEGNPVYVRTIVMSTRYTVTYPRG